MPVHYRNTIVDKIAEMLTGETGAGSKVYTDRARTIWPEKLPVVLVYADDETAEIINESPREYEKSLDVSVVVAISQDENWQDTLGDYSAKIETILLTDTSLSGVVADLILERTSFDRVQIGESVVATMRVDLVATYYQYLPAGLPDDATDFNGADVDWDTEEQDGSLEAEDTIELPAV